MPGGFPRRRRAGGVARGSVSGREVAAEASLSAASAGSKSSAPLPPLPSNGGSRRMFWGSITIFLYSLVNGLSGLGGLLAIRSGGTNCAEREVGCR